MAGPCGAKRDRGVVTATGSKYLAQRGPMPMQPLPNQLKSCEEQKTSGPLPYAARRLVYNEGEPSAYRPLGIVLTRF